MTCYQCGKQGEPTRGELRPPKWTETKEGTLCRLCSERAAWVEKKGADNWKVQEPAKFDPEWDY